MIRKLLNSTTASITSAAFMIGAASLLSRLLGVLRDRVFASQFGAGDILDAYYAAFRVPDFVFNLLVLGALSAGFIPVFAEYLAKDKKKEDAFRLVNAVFQYLLFGLVILVAVLAFFAEPIMRFVTPGFDGEKFALTVTMTRIMLLSPLLLGVSSLFGGILQTYKQFFAYSLAPVFYNLGIIAGATLLVPRMGVTGLAWGVVLGAALHMLIQLPGAVHSGFRIRLFEDMNHKGLKELVRLMIPRTITLAITQVNLFVMTIIASTLAVGSLTIFNFANNLQYFPIGIFGISFAIAAFPTMSAAWASGKSDEYYEIFYKTFGKIALLLMPISALFVLVDEQIVRLILGAGEFDLKSTQITALTMSYFAISIFFQGAIPLLIRSYYAKKNTRFPLFAATLSMILNIVLSIEFSRLYGVAGLGLAFSLSSAVQFSILWARLQIDVLRVFPSMAKIAVASTAMYFFGKYFEDSIMAFIPFSGFTHVLLNLSLISIVCVVFFFVFASLLNIKELDELMIVLKTRFVNMLKRFRDTGSAGSSEDVISH